MTAKIFTIGQKQFAGLRSSNKGGGLGILFISLAVIAVVFVVLIFSADYALYTYKRNLLSQGMDYAVCAAAQEIDTERSRIGLAEGFDMQTGKKLMNNIFLDQRKADNAFFTTFKENTGVHGSEIRDNLLIAAADSTADGLLYTVRAGPGTSKEVKRTGGPVQPQQLEQVINSMIRDYWTDSSGDRHVIYVSGNPNTNGFEKRPYYIVVIKNYEIDGIFKRREASFIAFKSSKVDRS